MSNHFEIFFMTKYTNCAIYLQKPGCRKKNLKSATPSEIAAAKKLIVGVEDSELRGRGDANPLFLKNITIVDEELFPEDGMQMRKLVAQSHNNYKEYKEKSSSRKVRNHFVFFLPGHD